MGSVSAAYASFAFLRSWRIISMMVGTTPFRTFQSGRISDSKMESNRKAADTCDETK